MRLAEVWRCQRASPHGHSPCCCCRSISPLPLGQPVTIPVLANDLDFEGQSLTIVSVTQPLQGTVSIDPGGQTVTYVPGGFSFASDTKSR
jgi:hypothetical protein